MYEGVKLVLKVLCVDPTSLDLKTGTVLLMFGTKNNLYRIDPRSYEHY